MEHPPIDDETTTRIFIRTVTGRPQLTRAATFHAAPQPARAAQLDGLWDANDVARYLKVSRSWVYHRAEAGLLPYIRVGGLLRFDADAIRAAAREAAQPTKRSAVFPVKRTR